MNRAVARYRRDLKKKLPCGIKTRKALLDRFEGMLDTFLEDQPDPTQESLRSAFGTPEVMANTLCESIPEGEVARYHCRMRLKKATAVVLLALVLLFAVYTFFFKETAVTSIDAVYQIDPPYSQTP